MVLVDIPLPPDDLNKALPDVPPKVVAYDTKLWFGKHKGKMACNVPGSYLLWCRDNIPGFKLTRSLSNAANHDAEEEAALRGQDGDDPNY